RIDALMSTWRDDTEMARVNARAASEPVEVSIELFDLIERALSFGTVTRGAFDVTYASAGFLFDYRERVKPHRQELNAALQVVDYRLVRLNRDDCTVKFLRDGMRIDLGGIAKGHAVERAVALLRERGIEHALVSAGGDTRVLGDRRGRPWSVGIRHPRGERRDVLASLPLVDEAISTSGDYERYFEEDGARYHHIINPRTGQSPADVRSVSVIGPDGVWTDALSTGVFVLGVAEGLELIESLDGYEAVIVDAGQQLHVSTGFDDGSDRGR
ncbi:MAG: FAD:protein FMN transferase, partial [Gammaproteobacteria bacterium]|nr:FAD:protein FMN transferase [Gammaproteobacteria bacterium]